MEIDTLKHALRAAPTRDHWVELVADYFAAHELHYGHGTDCPEDEAFWLVWHSSGQPADLTALAPDPVVGDRVAMLAHRRVIERMPLGYLLGSAWFGGLEFEVTPDVLIPRSPLAEVIEAGFAPWVTLEPGDRVLEIGTGSGCIAIAAAAHNPGVSVDATEIDPAAIRLARRNLHRHQLAGQVEIIAADLFPPGRAGYRVIITNPPYVPTASLSGLPPEYGHEPVVALDGGRDGLDVVRKILDDAGPYLAPDGVLIVEVGEAEEALIAAFPRIPWTWLEFERGGEGVFMLTAEECRNGWG